MSAGLAFRAQFVADHQAPARARAVVGRLEGRIAPQRLRMVRLLVSELVANSVRHGTSSTSEQVGLEAVLDAETLRVAVTDQGPGFDASAQPREPESRAVSGRGLWLVGKFSDRWGVETDDSTRVWFEVDLHG